MPEKVTRWGVRKGQKVKQGRGLLWLEAKTMNGAVDAPRDASVAEVMVEMRSTGPTQRVAGKWPMESLARSAESLRLGPQRPSGIGTYRGGYDTRDLEATKIGSCELGLFASQRKP